LDGPLIGGSYVLQHEGYDCVGICSKEGDECCVDLDFFHESNLVVTRLVVEERDQDAASRRVDDLVDAWEHEGILWAVFVEISAITHILHSLLFFFQIVPGWLTTRDGRLL
jgi:hypothetical protein